MKTITMNGGADWISYSVRGGCTVEIIDVFVGSNRRNGTGTHLINRLCSEVSKEDKQRLYVITRANNSEAISFYLSLGFKPTANLAKFYLDDNRETDGIMMDKII